MEKNKRCIETVALAAFRTNAEKIKAKIMKPKEENEETKENYDVSLLINDLPMNFKLVLLKPSKLNEISTFSGASVNIKGRYIPPEEKSKDGSKDQLLNLHIEGPNKQSILLALQKLEHLVKDAAGPEEKTQFFQVEKVLVGMEVAPAEFDLGGRVLGANGGNLQYIVSETEAEVTLRGRGSGYEEPDLGKESPEPLHIRVQHPRPEVVQAGRILALHLLETVQREFAEYCSRQAQLMVASQPVSIQEQSTPPSPLSDTSWSPSSHNAYMKDDREESDGWDRASPHSNTSSKVSSSENVEKCNPESSKPKQSKLEEKVTDAENTTVITNREKATEKTDACTPGEYVPWSRKRKARGGKKSKMYRDKINTYTETLKKLQNKYLQPEEKKELLDIIEVLKPKLESWWYVKKYGKKDLDTQYQKICVERLSLQRPKQMPPSGQVHPSGNIPRPRAALLPHAMCTPSMISGPMPVTFQSLPTTPRPPPPAMCYVPKSGPTTSQSHHGWSPRGQQNNQNFVGVTQGTQAARNYDQGNTWKMNQRSHLQNPSNVFSQGQWHNQSYPQTFQGSNSYPVTNLQSNTQNFQRPNPFFTPNQNFPNSWGQQNQMQPNFLMGHPERWQSPTQIPQGISRPLTPGWQNPGSAQAQRYQRMSLPMNNNFCSPQNSKGPQH